MCVHCALLRSGADAGEGNPHRYLYRTRSASEGEANILWYRCLICRAELTRSMRDAQSQWT
jgi:hypothetical protein